MVKKTDFNPKITDIEDKILHISYKFCINCSLITKADFDVKLKAISDRVFSNKSNKSKHFLVENELKKLEKFNAACFRGKNYFDYDGAQNVLVFQPVFK